MYAVYAGMAACMAVSLVASPAACLARDPARQRNFMHSPDQGMMLHLQSEERP